MTEHLTRRGLMAWTGATALAPTLAWGQESKAQLGSPATVVSSPPRQWGPEAPPAIYPDLPQCAISRS